MATHYDVLNISESATLDQIKARFQQLILQHHPDKRSDSQDDGHVHRILEAWEVLRDSERRKVYDAQLHATQQRDAVINDEVDLDDMQHNESTGIFTLECRCSGHYTIGEEDLEQGIDIACCDNCSLRIRVLYDVVEESD